MMKMLYLMVLTAVLIFSGCADKQPEFKPITVTKKCETHKPIKPIMSEEIGDNPTWLKAKLENSEKKDSYIFDLEAALEKCL